LIKKAFGQISLGTRSNLLSIIHTQVGTRGMNANVGNQSHHARAVIPTVIDTAGEISEPTTVFLMTSKEKG